MRNDRTMVEFLRSFKHGQIDVAPPMTAESEYEIQRFPHGTRRTLKSTQ